MNTEDAVNFLIEVLRKPHNSGCSRYGYEIYIPDIIYQYLQETLPNSRCQLNGPESKDLSPQFYAAAWDLCRRGIIRPGIRILGAQSTDDGGSGNGYSITPFGHQWLQESGDHMSVPTEPGRFAEMLRPHRDRYGPDFYERSQEAIRCYGAHAYLACCVMCGAASESILLSTAIAHNGDTETVLSTYNSSQGRSRVENMLLGQARKRLKQEFLGYMSLLKYWRDSAGHGASANIGDNEAYTSLALLLRLATYVDDWWAELTGASTET